jgi:hypothetical protein
LKEELDYFSQYASPLIQSFRHSAEGIDAGNRRSGKSGGIRQDGKVLGFLEGPHGFRIMSDSLPDEKKDNEDWVGGDAGLGGNKPQDAHPLHVVNGSGMSLISPVTGRFVRKPHVSYLRRGSIDEASRECGVLLEPFWANENNCGSGL